MKKKGLNISNAGLSLLLTGMLCLAGAGWLAAQDDVAPAAQPADAAPAAAVQPVEAVAPAETVEPAKAAEPAIAQPVAATQPAAVVAQPVDGVQAKSSASRTRLLSECNDIPGLAKNFNYLTDGMDVVKFINMLADPDVGGDLNLVISTKVSGMVRLTLKGVTVADALELALADSRLAYEVRGKGPRSIIKVMTDEEYRADHGVSFYEQRQVKVMDLRNTKPTRVASSLAELKSAIGKIIADDASGTLVLIDTPAKIEEMSVMVSKSERDQPLLTVSRVFRLQYADLADLTRVVTESLTKDIGKMTVNTKTKSLIVTDLAHNVDKISKMVEAFDRKPREVAIEAQVVEVELSDDFSMGVNWKHLFKGISPRFNLQSGAPLSAGVSPTLRYDTIISGGGELSLVVDALKTVGNTKVISKPQLSVLSGEQAMLKVVKQQPWKKVAYESGTTNIVGVNYEFIEIGTTLDVIPVINDEGFITVSIKPTISTLDGWYDAAPGSEGVVGIPVVKKSEASTSVTVKDGVTIIIGGMIKTEKRVSQLGVPILGSIPLLGRLFRTDTTKSVKTETIVFLTPRIITGEEPFLQMPTELKGLRADGGGVATGTPVVVETNVSAKEVKPRYRDWSKQSKP